MEIKWVGSNPKVCFYFCKYKFLPADMGLLFTALPDVLLVWILLTLALAAAIGCCCCCLASPDATKRRIVRHKWKNKNKTENIKETYVKSIERRKCQNKNNHRRLLAIPLIDINWDIFKWNRDGKMIHWNRQSTIWDRQKRDYCQISAKLFIVSTTKLFQGQISPEIVSNHRCLISIFVQTNCMNILYNMDCSVCNWTYYSIWIALSYKALLHNDKPFVVW